MKYVPTWKRMDCLGHEIKFGKNNPTESRKIPTLSVTNTTQLAKRLELRTIILAHMLKSRELWWEAKIQDLHFSIIDSAQIIEISKKELRL